MKMWGDSKVTTFAQTNHIARFQVNGKNGKVKISIVVLI